jgi:hypothetical protein
MADLYVWEMSFVTLCDIAKNRYKLGLKKCCSCNPFTYLPTLNFGGCYRNQNILFWPYAAEAAPHVIIIQTPSHCSSVL